MSCVGGRRGSLSFHFSDILEAIQAPATTRSRRASVAFVDCSPSASRRSPRPSRPTRRLVYVACPWPSTTCSLGASRTSSVRSTPLRRRIHIVGPVAIEDGPPAASGESPGPSTRLRRFLHVAYPVAVKNWSPRAWDILRIAFGPPPDDSRACLGAVHRASPRRPRFDPRRILREYREARDPESKTEGKIKASCQVFVSDGSDS
jgi:hypothetical protein